MDKASLLFLFLFGEVVGRLESFAEQKVYGKIQENEVVRSIMQPQLKTPLAQYRPELPLSVMAIEEVMRDVAGPAPLSQQQMLQNLVDVKKRITDELSLVVFQKIPSTKAHYLNALTLFGDAVFNNFPSTIFDIEEAGKCLALGRDTACVYHLMRVMEVGLRTLGKQLGIPYAPSWESYLRQIKDKIDVKHKKKGVRWKRDEAFFKDILGDLQSVKLAWRNPTMHMVKTFTSEEAEGIFNAVRILIGRLATKLAEVKR